MLMAMIMATGMIGCKSSEDVSTAPETVETPVPESPEEKITETTGEPAGESADTTEEVVQEPEDRNIDADGELMDFYGKNIDDLMADFPGLEITAQEGIYDKEGAQYMDKEEEFDGVLSGPTFDVDKDFNIVGITYSGRRFVLAGLCAAVDINDAKSILKENGWEFSDVDFAHGTAQYVANYTKDDMILTIVSTDEGEFGKTEESDLTGFVETVSVTKK